MPVRKSVEVTGVEVPEGGSISITEPSFAGPPRANRAAKSEGFAPEVSGNFKSYRWLDILNEAYKHGFVGFDASTVQPYETIDRNGKPMTTWVARAQAVFDDGSIHVAVGEANYENCNKTIGNSAARMAETRAKSRALAHALNLDANVDFEMEDPTNPAASAIPQQRAYTQRSVPAATGSVTARREDPSKFPPQNVPGGWACKICGTQLKDTEKSSAGQKAFWSARDNDGDILCWNHQQEAKSQAA